MKTIKYFFDCYFNQTFGFEKLDSRIEDFKREAFSTRKQLIEEIEELIKKNDYVFVSKFIEKYSDFMMARDKAERFINYLYDKLIDKPTKVKATDFIKKCRVIFCPVCTPDPEMAPLLNVINQATVISKNIQIYICKPCKLVWLDDNDIRADNAHDYKKFMKENGLKGLWKELKDIDVL